MKLVLFILVQVLLCVNCQVDPPPSSCPNSNGQYVTCKDCNKYALCNGDAVLAEGECSGTTPFCTSDGLSPCSERTAVATCNENNSVVPTIPTSCTGVGYFPSPNNCQQFLICQRANSAPAVQNCEVGYYYNRDSRRCVRGNTCITATCGTNLFATFGTTRNYYVLCVANQAPYVFRCSDNTQYTAGSNPPCVYRCTADGWFADSEDNRSYFDCSRNSALQFVQKKLVCPFEWTFNAVARVCSPSL